MMVIFILSKYFSLVLKVISIAHKQRILTSDGSAAGLKLRADVTIQAGFKGYSVWFLFPLFSFHPCLKSSAIK